MNDKIINGLRPLYDLIKTVDELVFENEELKKENAYLKERLSWHQKSLEENAKRSGEAVHTFINACLDGRIEIKGNKTIITSNDTED